MSKRAGGNTMTKKFNIIGSHMHLRLHVFTVASQWDSATYPVTYGYDTAGRMTALSTTRDGVELDTTLWLYDHATGLLTNKVYADGSRVRYTYTQSGRPLRTTWARGAWKENAYDALGQIAATAYSGGTPDVTLARNSFGTVTNVTDASGLVYRFAVNDRQAVTNETVISGTSTNTLTRLLDAFDRPAGLLLGSGYSLFCGRDSESRISVVSNAVFTARYEYTNGYAAVCALTFSNGNTLARAVIRDPRRPSLLTGVTNLFNGAPISSFAYTYDIVRRVTNRNSDAFGYNVRSELTSALVGAADYGYAYDSIGNRVWSAENALTNSCTANSLNQYTAAGSASPNYDTDGNTRWDGRMWHTWDAENRLTRSEPGWAGATNGAVMTDNRYDNRHRRHSKTVRQLSGRGAGYPLDPGQAGTWDEIETREFIYDDWNMVRETVSHTNGVTDVFEYFWGPDLSGTLQGAGGVGGLLAVAMNGSFYFPIYDNNGNVTDYIDESGATVAHRKYDPFGRTTVATGTMVSDFNFWFSTKYLNHETGLYYYGYRFYSPEIMRWLNRDPIEERDELNLYGFVGNDPVNRWDYLGLLSLNGCCNGTKYNKLTKCCCCNGKVKDGSNGDLLDRKKIVTGIRKCNIAAHKNPSGYPHGWLEVDGFSAGFGPASIENGAQGNISIPDARSGGLCFDIKLDPCEYNIETVKQAVKQLSIASQLFSPPYSRKCSNFFVCYTWRDEIINRAKEMGKSKCGTSNTTIELYE